MLIRMVPRFDGRLVTVMNAGSDEDWHRDVIGSTAGVRRHVVAGVCYIRQIPVVLGMII
jgi:hypothetical protein